MSDAADLISGDALKASAQRFLAEVRAKVDRNKAAFSAFSTAGSAGC
jgi:hypothetical protein